MGIKVRFYAGIREAAKTDETEIDLPAGGNVSDLLKLLAERYPEAKTFLQYVRVASDEAYLSNDSRIEDGQSISIIPPVSGG
jgi:molybdopterin converting factor subunit 1